MSIGKAEVWGRMPNSFCGLRFCLSRHETQSMLLKELSDVKNNYEQKWQRKSNLTFKINMPLPIDVGKAVGQGGRPNSVCGLSFSPVPS